MGSLARSVEAKKLAPKKAHGCLQREGEPSQWRNRLPQKERPGGVSHTRRWPTIGRFFDVLNTWIAVLVVLVLAVSINAFLYFGHLPPEARTDRSEPQRPTVERTERRAEPREVPRPASTTVLSTTPTQPTATASASATASATASASSSP